MNISAKLCISFLLILFPLFCHAQNARLDSLLNVLENDKGNLLDGYRTLIHVLKTYRNAAHFNVLRIKVYYDEKEIKEVEKQYRITQVEVNKYLDTMLLYMKDPDYAYQFAQLNNQLKNALFSIRDLNRIFSKYDYHKSLPNPQIFVDKPRVIKKVVKHSIELRRTFGDYENGADIHGQIKNTKGAYWRDLEDEQFILRVPKQKRK
jgi:hypothetical protein